MDAYEKAYENIYKYVYLEGMRAWLIPSYLTVCDPMDCSLLGSSVHGILQAKILEWVSLSSCGGSS